MNRRVLLPVVLLALVASGLLASGAPAVAHTVLDRLPNGYSPFVSPASWPRVDPSAVLVDGWVELPFTFMFFGAPKGAVFAHPSGVLAFDGSVSDQQDSDVLSLALRNMIAPNWRSGTVATITLSTSEEGARFLWENAEGASHAVLMRPDGSLRFEYGPDPSLAEGIIGVSNGGTQLIVIEEGELSTHFREAVDFTPDRPHSGPDVWVERPIPGGVYHDDVLVGVRTDGGSDAIVRGPLTIAGRADSPATIMWVELYVDGVLIGRSVAVRTEAEWRPPHEVPTSHEIRVVALDGAGLVHESRMSVIGSAR